MEIDIALVGVLGHRVDLAGSVVVGHENIVVDLEIATLVHDLDAIEISVGNDAVTDHEMSFDIAVDSPSLLGGATDFSSCGRLADHKFAAGKATFGSTCDRIVRFSGAIQSLLTHVDRETVDHDCLGAAAGNIDVDPRLGTVLGHMAGICLDISLVDVRIPLREILIVTAHQGDIFLYVDESLVESSSIVTGGYADHITVTCLIKSLLDILIRSLGRLTVVLVGSGRGNIPCGTVTGFRSTTPAFRNIRGRSVGFLGRGLISGILSTLLNGFASLVKSIVNCPVGTHLDLGLGSVLGAAGNVIEDLRGSDLSC